MKFRYYGSSLSLSDVDPNNSYGWKLSFKKGSVYSLLIGLFGAPHLGARIRHRILTKILKKPKKRFRVLDVGCGFGLESLHLSKKGYNVMGLDISTGKIDVAKKIKTKLKDKKVKFLVSDVFKYNNQNGLFDFVILFEVLEHVNDPKKLLGKLSEIVKNGGEVVISFPSTHKINSMSKEYLGHTHLGYNPKIIKKMIKEKGLSVKKVYSFGNSFFAKMFFYVDYYLLRHLPLISAVFFFISYPVAVLDIEHFADKDPMGYVMILKKNK